MARSGMGRRITRWQRLTLGALVLVCGATAVGLSLPETADVEAAPRRSSSPSCGATIYKSDGRAWVCTFSDDFSGSRVDSTKWLPALTAQTGYTHGDCFINDPANISVSNGVLRLTTRRAAEPFLCDSNTTDFETQYTSGGLTTWTKFSQTYGRFEFRAAFPATTVPGSLSALWLWPNNPAKYAPYKSGEIDVAEYFTLYPDRAIPFVHYTHDGTDPNVTNNHCYIADPTAMHTYTLEWNTQEIRISYDGKLCIAENWQPVGLTKPAPFDHPFFINLTQGVGKGTNLVSASTPMPNTTVVDYVRVWR